MLKSRIRTLNQFQIKNRIVATPSNQSSINEKNSTLSLSREESRIDTLLQENEPKYSPKKYMSKGFTNTPTAKSKKTEKVPSAFEPRQLGERMPQTNWKYNEESFQKQKSRKYIKNGMGTKSREHHEENSENIRLKKLKEIQSMLINLQESKQKPQNSSEREKKSEVKFWKDRFQQLELELEDKNTKFTEIELQLSQSLKKNQQLMEKNEQLMFDLQQINKEKKELIRNNIQSQTILEEIKKRSKEQIDSILAQNQRQIQKIKNEKQQQIMQSQQKSQCEIKSIIGNYEEQKQKIEEFYEDTIHSFEEKISAYQQNQSYLEAHLQLSKEEITSLKASIEEKKSLKQVKQVQTSEQIFYIELQNQEQSIFSQKINQILSKIRLAWQQKINQLEEKVKKMEKAGKKVCMTLNEKNIIETNTSIMLNSCHETRKSIEGGNSQQQFKPLIKRLRLDLEQKDRQIGEYSKCMEQYRGLVMELKKKVENQQTIQDYYYEVLQIFDIDGQCQDIQDELIKMINKMAGKVQSNMEAVEELEQRINKLEEDKEDCLKNIRDQQWLVTCAIKAKADVQKRLTLKTQQEEKLLAHISQLQSLIKSLNECIILKELQKRNST